MMARSTLSGIVHAAPTLVWAIPVAVLTAPVTLVVIVFNAFLLLAQRPIIPVGAALVAVLLTLSRVDEAYSKTRPYAVLRRHAPGRWALLLLIAFLVYVAGFCYTAMFILKPATPGSAPYL